MTDYDPILTAAPALPPVSRDECKKHLRVDGTDEDTLIDIYLAAAVSHLDGEDGWLGRAIVAQTWAQDFDAFARLIRLGLSPVTAISSVKYYDVAGVLQTVDPASYALINGADAPEVRFDVDYSFPGVRADLPVLTVTFVAGYGDDSDAPAPIKAAILLMVGDMFQNREAKVETSLMDNSTVHRLLDPYRRAWMA